ADRDAARDPPPRDPPPARRHRARAHARRGRCMDDARAARHLRRRRLPRYERHHRRTRAHHARPRRGGRQARTRRGGPAHRRHGRPHEVRPLGLRPGRPDRGGRHRHHRHGTRAGLRRGDRDRRSEGRARMILTVTLNPSLDRTIEVASLEPGAVNRALRTRLDPGGKGVNVTRALLANGHDSRAVVPLGGPDGAQLLALLEAERVLVSSVPVAGHTRSNVTVAEPDGSVTKLNEPGASLTPAELETLTGLVLELSAPGDWVVLCGSLPPGVDEGEYAAMTRLLRGSG